jgi:hypothetical protein
MARLLKTMQPWEVMLEKKPVLYRSSSHWHPYGELVLGNHWNLQIVRGIQHYADNRPRLQILKMASQLPKLVLGRPVADISAPSLAMLLSQALLHQTRPPLVGVIVCSVRRRQPEARARPQSQRR